jgi:hypothetical protein
MAHVTEDRQTNQRIKVYFLTTIMMDVVFDTDLVGHRVPTIRT